jgi:hypothetical protein
MTGGVATPRRPSGIRGIEKHMKPILDLPTEDGPAWLTTAKLADYLGYEGRHRVISAHRWIAAKGVRKHYRSQRCVLVKRADVDRVLEGNAAR